MAPPPPARYQGDTAFMVGTADSVSVHVFCAQGEPLPPDVIVHACAFPKDRFVALPNPCLPRFAGESFAALFCHEKGHILGWGADHGG